MLKDHRQQHQQQQQLREEAARAVLRDATQRGHGCVELRRDGRRPIFFCTLCHTRCYNDASLWDHLRGNPHSRHLAGHGFVKAEKQASDISSSSSSASAIVRFVHNPQQQRGHAKMHLDFRVHAKLPLVALPELHLRLVDQGQMFVKIRPCSGVQIAEACWLEKRVLIKQQQQGGGIEYGILVFPYSDGLGRGNTGISSPAADACLMINQASQVLSTIVEPQKTSGGCRGRKRAVPTERICFICRQKMVPGKDVATLLNIGNKQMMCHSRNWLGAFHVYHTCCLINWILIFDAKFWMGQSLNFSRNYRKSLMNGGLLNSGLQEKPIFCPECQGTGFRYAGGHLEPPRYRLAQIFDWVLELVQARKLWIDRLGQEVTGLMFHASKGVCHPREFESSLVLPRGALQFFYTESNSKLDVKIDRDGATNMDIDT